MKAHYQTIKLGDLCHIARGGSPRPIQAYLTDAADGINWIKISDATASEKYIEYTKEKIRPEGLKNSRLVKPGDFILSNSMSFGRPYIMKTTGCIHDGWLVLSDKSGLFDPDFLYHFLGSDAAFRQFDRLAAGSTVRNLNSDLVKTVDVPIPPLDEQRRIVAVLDKAFAGIATATANAQKNLTNARELLESYMGSIFKERGQGWSDELIGSIADTALGKMLDKQKNKGDFQPYLRNINVRWFEFDLTDLLEMRFENSESERYSIRKGDVVICEGGYPGRAAIWESDEPIFFQKALHRVRFARSELAKWLVYILYHADSTGQLRQHFTGAGIQHFTGQALKNFVIPVPPLSELNGIICRIDRIFSQLNLLQANYQSKLRALEQLKQSLLQKAFAGELT